jgi:glyoxylase-like metal-dependent hydrolase (beta-lactamase superfamily II)
VVEQVRVAPPHAGTAEQRVVEDERLVVREAGRLLDEHAAEREGADAGGVFQRWARERRRLPHEADTIPDPVRVTLSATMHETVLMADSTPRQVPLEVAHETFLIRAVQFSLGQDLSTNHNSLVIRAAEPVIVDTGMVTNRVEFFDDVSSLVDPDDVRWIFMTHDDDDHAGNLVEALDRFPNATVVISWAASGRMRASFGIPPERILTVDDGETLDVGDRVLRAVRPPVYDSAYTRGLFDPTTRVLHAADAFCAPMPAEPVDHVDQVPVDLWERGFPMFHHFSLCPWVAMVDESKYRTEVAKLAGLGADVIVGAHTPVISGPARARAFELLAALPATTPPPLSPGGDGLIAGHQTEPRVR